MRTLQAEIFALSLSILLVVACARLPESLGGAPGPAWERAPALVEQPGSGHSVGQLPPGPTLRNPFL